MEGFKGSMKLIVNRTSLLHVDHPKALNGNRGSFHGPFEICPGPPNLLEMQMRVRPWIAWQSHFLYTVSIKRGSKLAD